MQPLRRFVLVLFCLCLSGQLPAQSPDPDRLLDFLDTAPFEYYLDKADRQDMEDQWMRYARYGLQSALASWEREALLLMGEDFDLSSCKAEAEETLEDLLKKRFALWLSNTFFQRLEPLSLAKLSEDITSLNEAYLYEKDENGDPIYDAGGNAVYKTSIDFREEKELWSAGVVTAIEDLLSSWEQKMVTSGDVFLSSVSDPDLKEYLTQAYDGNFSSWDKNYRKELYRLYYLEQSRFVRLRLYDQRSLERITERETAEYISNQLIAQTQIALNAGLENLMTGLEAEVLTPTGEGEEVETEQWMASFRSLLESGLLAWDRAEEELLLERVQWEQAGGRELAEAEEAWAESFKTLREKRSEWMESYRRALEEGNALWGQESEDLERVIENAIVELDASLENEKASLQSRMDNLIGMLLQSVNMLRTARTSWEYWMDQYDGGEMGSFDSSAVDFDIRAMRRASLIACLDDFGLAEPEEILLHVIDKLEENSGDNVGFWEDLPADEEITAIVDTYEPYQALSDEEKAVERTQLNEALGQLYTQIGEVLKGTHSSASLKEAFYWVEEVFAVYQRYARETQDTLGATYGVVVFNDESLRTAFDAAGKPNDLLMAGGETTDGQGLLNSAFLYDDSLWEQLYLDPYQVEILKARAYMQYWQKQGILAQAVYDYARDHSSTKEEASVTEERLTEAKDEYDAVLIEYQALVHQLDTLGSDLEERGTQMAALQRQIADAQEELAAAREELALVFGDLRVNNPQFLAEQYRAHYVELLAAYGMDGDKEIQGLGSAFEEYLLAAREYGLEEKIALVSSKVLSLVSGEEDQDMGSSFFNPEAASLRVLHQRMIDTSEAGFTVDHEEANEGGLFFLGEQAEYEYDSYLKETLHLRMTDYRYEVMLDLYDRFYHGDEAETGMILWQMQRIVRDIQVGTMREYELRLARIALLTCDSFVDWVDTYFPDIPREGAETTEELYAFVSGGETCDPLDGVLSSVTADMAVYQQILEEYNDFLSEGGEGTFALYTWDPDLVSGGSETLNPNQGMQRLWEYQVKALRGNEAEAAEEMSRMVEALQALHDYLAALGSLDGHTEEIENALLYGQYLDDFLTSRGVPEEKRLSYNYLKAYLNGSGALITDEENLVGYFRREEAVDDAMRASLVSILTEESDEAPVLREMAAEQAYDSLITRLVDAGLMKNDRVSLKRPEAIWNENSFTEASDVVTWVRDINGMFEDIPRTLPSYVYEELSCFLGEVKNYISVRAVQTWPEGVNDDIERLNEEILAFQEENGKLQTLLSRLMTEGSGGGAGALWEIIASLEGDDPLYTGAAERFVETVGFDLAYRASLTDGFSATDMEWDSLLHEYLVDNGLDGHEGLEGFSPALVAAASESYALAEAIAVPEGTDWSSLPDEWRRPYLSGLWNSYDFDSALSSLSGDDAVITRQALEFLRLVDIHLDGEETEGVPGDRVLLWVYRGNEVCREFDNLIDDGWVDEWANEDYDFVSDILNRYYPYGLTPKEAALNPAPPTAIEGVYGLLRLYARLTMIHENLTAEGGYGEEFGFEDMITLMTSQLSLEAGDLGLLLSIEEGETDTLKAWLTEKEEIEQTEDLTGSDLYWNLLWKARTAFREGSFIAEDFKEQWIFGSNSTLALTLKGWLESQGSSDTAGLRSAYAELLQTQATDLVTLSQKPEGSLYAHMLKFGLEASLREKGGYATADAVAMTAWFFEETGIVPEDERGVDEYLTQPENQRLLWILEEHPEALEHYLKKKILTGHPEESEILQIIQSIEIPGLREELVDFFDIYEAVRSYNRLLHGDVGPWLENRYPDDEGRRLEVRAAYERFLGSDMSRWDDSVFMIAVGLDEVPVSEILESIACNKTRGYSDILYGTDGSVLSTGGQSVNGVFLNTVEETLLARLRDTERMEELSEIIALKEFITRSKEWVRSLETEGHDHWRTFLSEEYLASENDEPSLIPVGTVDLLHEDYGRDLVIGDTGDEAALGVYAVLHPFSQTGSEAENYLLDAANSCLDRAAFFVGALETWTTAGSAAVQAGKEDLSLLIQGLTDNSGESFILDGEEYDSVWNCLESLDSSDLQERFSYEADAAVAACYVEGRSLFKGLLSSIEGLKDSLGLFGRRREIVQALADAGEDEISEALMPLKEEIAALESRIAEDQALWQDMIDREDGGYRQLEREYADIYALAREAFGKLDEEKQDYLLARALYDYATAGYIDAGEEAEDDEVLDDIPEEMLQTLENVTPAKRLAYVNERLTRATAAYDALVTIVNDNREKNYNIYEKDPVYRSLFEAYLTYFRESLALNKMNQVLNKAVARQETVVRKALEDWNTVRRESYSPISVRDVGGEVDISTFTDLGLGLSQQSDGTWSLSWGNGDLTDEEATGYFEASDDSERGLSPFEEDLVRWLSVINDLQANNSGKLEETMEKWGMALLWEDYLKQSALSDFDEGAFFSQYLDQVKEQDLDRDGAKALLLASWEEAYNTRASGLTDGQWMFDFYKLLDKSGSMSIETENGNGKADFTSFAEKESLMLANKYMAAGKKEEGRRLVLASIPVFAMAAVYFAMAIAAASILPFGWIAAIPLLAVFCFLMVKGADLAGEGNMLKAAARKIESSVTTTEQQKNRIFEDFRTDTGNILQKQRLYEAELEKLNAMKGAAEDGETLTDEERIAGLKDSVLCAFNEENENIGGLLKKAGVLSEEENEEDPETISAALNELFGLYQGRMSESAKAEAANSQALISALEGEAVEAKQGASRELNDSLTAENGAAKKHQEVCEAYRHSYLEYIRGEIEQEEFEAAADAAFADPVFSVREHLLRMYEQQNMLAQDILGDDQFGSDISRDLLADQEALLAGTGSAKGIIDYRQEAYREVRLFELTMLRVETAERRKQWEDQMSAIMAKGQMEWTAGTRKMRSRYETWIEETNRRYNKQKEIWNDKYLDFLSDKQAWMEAVSIQSTQYGDEDVLKNFGEMTRSALDAAGEDVLIGDFQAYGVDPEEILSEVIDLELLETLLENARSLNSGIGGVEAVFFAAQRPDEFSTADTLQAIQDFQSLKNEEFERHIAQLEFSRLLDGLSLAEERFYLQIESANESVKQGLHKTFTDDGYILEGTLYTKSLVVGATINEYLEETGTVRRYQYYQPKNVDFGSDLEAQEGNLESMSSESLEGLLDKAIASIEEKTEEIFGDTEDPGSFLLPEDLLKNDGSRANREGDSLSTEDYDFLQVLSGLDENGEPMETYRGVNMTPGFFGRHVGYAPGFSDEADTTLAWDAAGQIEFEGLGEMGEIMGQFIFNKIKEGCGWAEVNSPHYKKKLWDDRETWIEAPSIQDITELSTTALSIATGGTGALFLGLVDDAVFTSADVDQGLMTWDEGLVSFGKTVAASAVTSFMPGMSTEGMSIFEAAMATAGNRFATNMATGVIGSITYSSDGGWGFDGQAYADSLVGEAALAGYAGSFFSTYTSDTITGAMGGLTEGFYGSLADLGGEVAGKAAEYAVYAGFQFADDGFGGIGTSLTTAFDDMGGVSLNIANLGALLDMTRLAAVKGTDNYNDQFMNGMAKAADSLAETGLFALNFTSSGVRGRISTEGINLGGNLYNLGKGFVADMAIRNYTKENGNGDLLKYGYAYGDQTFEDTIWRILSNKDSLAYDAEEGDAETVKTAKGGRTIRLASSYKEITNKEDLLKALTVLQHEAHRDGTVTTDNIKETFRAVLAHSSITMELAGEYGMDFLLADENLVLDMLALMGLDGGGRSFEEYVAEAYESEGDFWRVVIDENYQVTGVLEDGDKSTITIVDQQGNPKSVSLARGSLSGQIAELVSQFQDSDEKQDKAEINAVMVASGLDYKTGKGWFAAVDSGKYHGPSIDPLDYVRKEYGYMAAYAMKYYMGQNSSTDISQEDLEEAFGLDDHSACAIAAAAEMTNNFLQNMYGSSLSAEDLIDAVGSSQGEMFDDESRVLSWNGLNAVISLAGGYDNYPVFYKTYDSLEALQADGIQYYLKKATYVKDPDRTHFLSWSKGLLDDPNTSKGYEWWNRRNEYYFVYYGFKPKYGALR